MTDETILKLMTSPIEEDVVIGANYLIKRPLQDIISFYDRYGVNAGITSAHEKGFYSEFKLLTEYRAPFIKVVKDNYGIWIGATRSYILDLSEFLPQSDGWHDKTI